jgi:hypothetical protein
MPEGVPTAGLVLIVEVVAEALLLDAPRRRFSESCAAGAGPVTPEQVRRRASLGRTT